MSASGGDEDDSIRFRTALRNTVLDVMKARGWRETESEIEWDFHWADVHWVHETFDHMHLSDSQRINHFRNHYELTRKDLLVKNMKRMKRQTEKEYGRSEGSKFDFIPVSYVLPQEHALFQEEFRRNPGEIWIMKPVGRAQGKGIFLINKMSQISQWRKDLKGQPLEKEREKGEPSQPVEAYIVQRYISNPYLISGKKFDLRLNGFCRFSNVHFSMNVKDITNMFIHATNVAIQKHSPNYDGEKGCKWLLRNLKMYLASKHGTSVAKRVFTDIEALIVRSLLSVQKVMIQDKHCFELYGYDILIDNNLKPWLIEVNASPSMTAETTMDYHLKKSVLSDCFDILDLERRYAEKGLRQSVGGFDLIYNEGPTKHELTGAFSSSLGSIITTFVFTLTRQ